MTVPVNITETFESFARDFEQTVIDDHWSRLDKYFTEDATYLNVGSADPKCLGRKAILDYLKTDVANTDRRFDSRTLVALSAPVIDGKRLTRRWKTTYKLKGVPDLVVEGEARYLFEGNLIKVLEEEPTASSIENLIAWMERYGHRL